MKSEPLNSLVPPQLALFDEGSHVEQGIVRHDRFGYEGRNVTVIYHFEKDNAIFHHLEEKQFPDGWTSVLDKKQFDNWWNAVSGSSASNERNR